MNRSWVLLASVLLPACTTMGSRWMAQPLTSDDVPETTTAGASTGPKSTSSAQRTTTILSEDQSPSGAKTLSDEPLHAGPPVTGKLQGRVLGKFRNTYYDFPNESDFKGAAVSLKSASCETIREVPRGFFEALCVQGSGTLANRQTVSFAKRDCSCAEVCPKTGQKICFDALDASKFPYGRGAAGTPITPLYSVAVDTSVIPLGTTIYVPELDGMPRDAESTGLHDGCFVAQDRGLRVQGQHVDVFTGDASMTRLWNKLVPSNSGVTVVLDSPRCATAATATEPSTGPAPTSTEPPPKKEKRRNKKSDKSEKSD